MRGKMADTIDEVQTLPRRIPADEAEEIRAFLGWIYDNQFTFLGYREFRFTGRGKLSRINVNKKSGLGILSKSERTVFKEIQKIQSRASRGSGSDVLLVTKANARSTIHRPVPLDTIGVKRFDAKGRRPVYLRGIFSQSPRHSASAPAVGKDHATGQPSGGKSRCQSFGAYS
jgi:glutamate dehydrogenase